MTNDDTTDVLIRTAEDADNISDAIESVYNGWFKQGGDIDWHDFMDRLESYDNYDLGEDMMSPAIKRIKQIVRTIRKEQG